MSTQRQPRRGPEPRPPPQGLPEGPAALLSAHTPCGPCTPSPAQPSLGQERSAAVTCPWTLVSKHSWGPWGSSGGLTEGPFIATSSCCDDESEARVWPLLPRPPGTLRPQAPRPVHQDHLIPESQGHWLEKTLPLPGSHPPPLLKRCHFAESSAWPDQTPAVQRERESAEGSWRGNMGSTSSRPRPLLPPRAPREAQA